MQVLKNVFYNKKVLITGHTGFKGSWLSIWLLELGAQIVGISVDIPSSPSHFEAASLKKLVTDYREDIRNPEALKKIIFKEQPDFIFHLAAQPLVKLSYSNPLDTWNTNTIGTANLLDSLREYPKKCNVILITSDKCYDNVEWEWGYRETDKLGGPDPYSASKGAAELVIKSYVKSFFPKEGNIRIAIGRAGNVIGGGDWAQDRIIPDCVKSWSENKSVELRNPIATRPWQHVLEPLSGYLNLAIELDKNSSIHGEPFNFGPPAQQNHSVGELVNEMANHWEKVKWEDVSAKYGGPYESGLLKLNCDKALHFLGWQAVWNFNETVQETALWYKNYYNSGQNSDNIFNFSLSQIKDYVNLANKIGVKWAL